LPKNGIEYRMGVDPSEGFSNFGQQLEQVIIDAALAREITDFNPFLGRTPERIAEAKLEAEKNLEEARKLFVKDYDLRIRDTEALAQFQKKYATLTLEQQTAISEKLAALGNAEFDRLVEYGFELIKIQNDVRDGTRQIDELNQKILKESGAARTGIILQNRKIIAQNYKLESDSIIASREKLQAVEEQINLRRFDKEKQFAGDITILNDQLKDKIVGFSELTYEQKLVILKEYLEAEVTATETAEEKKQAAQQKTIDKILEGIQTFQAALQAVQQTVSDYYNFQFEQLDKRNKRIQDSIVGESERANQLRLEADKAYTAEREKLEKRQAKVALRLTLAQTIANVAQAVAQNLGNPILAGIIAAAGVGQIAIISQQIAAVDSYKRGGRIRKGQGGLVTGPSHEEGGVKFQGGGIELEGNEAVINRVSTLRYADILSSINVSGGGKPIIMSNFDDSRLIEAIAKQRQTPIRAYVVESDITQAQTINKRLELLSQI
jgi:hypothetical protein